MWTISATAHTNASVGKVWAIYQDVAHWPVWDKGLVMYQPHGPFATGSQGLLQAVGGPGLRFELILVEDGHQFVDRTPIGPDAAIIGRHEQLGMASGTQITHTIEIHSPDAEGLALAIGFRQEELQETVTALARYAEEITMLKPHFWIGVVSREHVQKGVELGIAQLNHGKRDALARMRQGDWLIYYSPRTSYPSGDPLQAFTAIGQITSETPYQVTLSDDFHPFRHDVRYLACHEVSIQQVLADLTFLPDKQRWGARFRFGHLIIPEADFHLIARAMGVIVTESADSADAAISF